MDRFFSNILFIYVILCSSGGIQWLQHQANNEVFNHELKTAARMQEVARVSGLARCGLNSIVWLFLRF